MTRDEINARMQRRYDELMHIGKHGHYETMFRVFHEMGNVLIAQGKQEAFQVLTKAIWEPDAPKPRFSETFCSQCGAAFGPGDSGFSHCGDHRRKKEAE